MNKFYLCLMLIFLNLSTWAQENSRNNYTGNWTSNASWTDNSAAAVTNICCRNHNIYGNIMRNGDLTFTNNNNGFDFVIRDTLVVVGNMAFANDAMNLVVPQGGVLIVFGNLTISNKILIENGGILAIRGVMDFNGGNGHGDYDNTGNGGLYVGQGVTGNHADIEASSQAQTLDKLPKYLYDYISQDPAGTIFPLPVDLLYFRSQNSVQGIQLEWASTKEWNFSHYTVERSENGRDFAAIHEEYVSESESYGMQTYQYLDQRPLYGANYYRLKTTDVDGTIEYKGITLAYAGMTGQVRVSPNPAKGGLITIHYPGTTAEGSWLSIMAASGHEIMKIQMTEKELRLPAESLAPGVYIISVSNQLETKQQRLIVQ